MNMDGNESIKASKDGVSPLVKALREYGLREGMGESIEVLRRSSNPFTSGLNEEDFNTFMEADGVVSK